MSYFINKFILFLPEPRTLHGRVEPWVGSARGRMFSMRHSQVRSSLGVGGRSVAWCDECSQISYVTLMIFQQRFLELSLTSRSAVTKAHLHPSIPHRKEDRGVFHHSLSIQHGFLASSPASGPPGFSSLNDDGQTVRHEEVSQHRNRTCSGFVPCQSRWRSYWVRHGRLMLSLLPTDQYD